MHSYLNSNPGFKIFAHRGLIYLDGESVIDENTVAAFQNALAAGANYLELDVQSSSDGIAVVFHDISLNRISNQNGLVSDFSWQELQKIVLKHGGRISSLEQILKLFPNSRINIDVKSADSIPNLIESIDKASAQSRVLLTSFSEKRRLRALRGCPGVATSPSARLLFQIKCAQVIGIGLSRLLKALDVIQIPVSYGPLRLDSPRFIEAVKRHGVEVVYWTINDPSEALRLRKLGANGIVTDRTDLMAKTLI